MPGIQADEGKLYLCATRDVRPNKIVGYSIDDRMKARLAVTALRYAIAARPHAHIVVHSDRGSQFRSRIFVKELADNGLKGSRARWVGSVHVRIMRPWNHSSRYVRRTYSTATRGPQGRNCASRWCTGSKAATIANDANVGSAGSRPSSLK
jgi:transposase InsO family protein